LYAVDDWLGNPSHPDHTNSCCQFACQTSDGVQPMTVGTPQSRHETSPSPFSRDDPAGGMILKRHALALLALSFGLIVGACAQVSGTVSDAWPHWAGGEPSGTPPRPGTPGYQDFIAHRQAATSSDQQPQPAETGGAAAQPAAAATPVARPPSPGPAQPPAQDTAVAGGGLY
jgi:hypothetical protein